MGCCSSDPAKPPSAAEAPNKEKANAKQKNEPENWRDALKATDPEDVALLLDNGKTKSGEKGKTAEKSPKSPEKEGKQAEKGKNGEQHTRESYIDDPKIMSHISKVPLLASLSAEETKTLATKLTLENFNKGDAIIEQGTEGQAFYLIVKGQCGVSTKEQGSLSTLGEGDYFGEMALKNNAKRSATITAKGEVQTLVLQREDFEELFGNRIKFPKRTAISAETRNRENSDVKAPANAQRTKTAAQRERIVQVIKENILFQKLSLDQCNDIVDFMWLREVVAGETIIQQGDTGDNFYVIEKGSFNILVAPEHDPTRPSKVAVFGPGQAVGELALMYNAPRAATVQASVESLVWVVDRATFRDKVTQSNRQKIKQYEEFLSCVESLRSLLSVERAQIAEALEEVSFQDGDKIVTQDESGDSFFILKQGKVVATIETDGVAKEVQVYGPGDYFGERALIKSEPRAATCSAVGPCDVLKLDRDSFVRMLGSLEDIFHDKEAGYQRVRASVDAGSEYGRTSSPGSLNGIEFSSLDTDPPKKEDLVSLGVLGHGSYGTVILVKDSRTAMTYALKSVWKAQITKLGQEDHIMNEKRVMSMLNHPFIVRLHTTYQDKDRLYFLLEPSLGGELFRLLRARRHFTEDQARFFSAAVVLAFDFMHQKNIIYRDLKPENLLLDNDGYLKITDFGFAKILKGRTYTFCGTPDYLAPEVVSASGHGKGVDWWCMGILIYEMLQGIAPFFDDDMMKICHKILYGQVSFPAHFSKEAKSIVRKFLDKKASKRLGRLKGGVKLIEQQAFFKGFDWEAFMAKQMKAPFIPTVNSREDLSNFDSYGPGGGEGQQQPYEGDSKWAKDF